MKANYGLGPLLLRLQAKLSGGHTAHLIEVETSFSKGAVLDMWAKLN